MALDNTAKIGDIVTALQSVQGINQKADLKSALVAKGVNTLDTDNVAELINKLNTANLVLEGKKWASGTVTSGGNAEKYTFANDTMSASLYSISVNGLDFTPSIIIARYITDSYENTTFYTKDIIGGFYPDTVKVTGFTRASGSGSAYNIKANTSPAYVINGAFKLPTSGGLVVYTWIAIE